MTKVLLTGATGNVGKEVLRSLQDNNHGLEIYAGVRDLDEGRMTLQDFNVNFSIFDFTDPNSYKTSLPSCDILFLLRPPQISDVEKYFIPIIAACREAGVKHIIFLSVQGVEKSKIIPHHKIEKLIVESQIPYTFLRPAYFMQNFTTTLHRDLVKNKQIYLPAGNAKFTLIDIRDIGAVAAAILMNIEVHINKSYDLTNKEKLTFAEMATALNEILGKNIQYNSPNLLNFFLTKKKENTPTPLIFVMIMLHYFPRFQKEPPVSDAMQKILGREPITFKQFIKDHREELTE